MKIAEIPLEQEVISLRLQNRQLSDSLKNLIELNSQLVIEHLKHIGLKTLTLDLDGTVLSTKGKL